MSLCPNGQVPSKVNVGPWCLFFLSIYQLFFKINNRDDQLLIVPPACMSHQLQTCDKPNPTSTLEVSKFSDSMAGCTFQIITVLVICYINFINFLKIRTLHWQFIDPGLLFDMKAHMIVPNGNNLEITACQCFQIKLSDKICI